VKSQAKTVRIFHALSDETRLAVLERLKNGERCVCDLVDLIGAGQSLLSFHMKVLKEAGLVSDRRHGRWIHYKLNPEGLEEARRTIGFLRAGRAPTATPACCAK